MRRQYYDEEISRILCQELVISKTVDGRLDETYNLIRANARQIRDGGSDNAGSRAYKKHRKGTRRIGRKLGLAAAVMVLVAAASLAVAAAGGFFVKEDEQTGDSLTYKFQIDYTLVPKDFEAEPGYLPDGYQKMHKGKYHKDKYSAISIMAVNSKVIDEDGDRFSCTGVESVSKDTLGGMEADIVQLKENKLLYHPFDKRIYMFNSEMGFVIALYGTDLVEMDELKKVADSVSVREVESDISYTAEALKDVRRERLEDEQDKSIAAYEAGVPADAVTPMGEEAGALSRDGTGLSDGVRYTVSEARYADSLNELPVLEEKFFVDYEENSWWIREDGTLKTQGRAKQVSWPMTGEEEIEQIGQKYLLVRIKAKNYNDFQETVQGGLYAYLLHPEEDGHYSFVDEGVHAQVENDDIQMDSKPFYFDGAENIEGEARKGFYYSYMEPGEEKEFTLIWAVDEDVIDNVYLMVDYNGQYEPGCYENKRYMSIR